MGVGISEFRNGRLVSYKHERKGALKAQTQGEIFAGRIACSLLLLVALLLGAHRRHDFVHAALCHGPVGPALLDGVPVWQLVCCRWCGGTRFEGRMRT